MTSASPPSQPRAFHHQERNSSTEVEETLPPLDETTARSNIDQVSKEDVLQGLSQASGWLTQLHTLSYLTLFAILGTLARLGLQSLTVYPSAPTAFPSLWSNFSGTFMMGFLYEDRKLFKHERGMDLGSTAPKNHLSTKKTIPLYIGLTTGFCGSFTSFSSFARDLFLALSNDLSPSTARNGGYSLLAPLAVLIATLSISIAAFHLGTHLALGMQPLLPSLPYPRRTLDTFSIPLAAGSWVGALLLSIFPPSPVWRGQVLFALIFAPLGCLLRFYISLTLNGRLFAAFPLGTFAVNMLATLVLGVVWDLQHVPLGEGLACQVDQGVMDGFCGCLSTVSTWVAELVEGGVGGGVGGGGGGGPGSGVGGRAEGGRGEGGDAEVRKLKKNLASAYCYGAASVCGGLALLVLIMGGLRWTRGFGDVLCMH